MSILRPKFTTSGYFSKKKKRNKKKSKSINLKDSVDENEDILDHTKQKPVGKKGFKGSRIFNFLCCLYPGNYCRSSKKRKFIKTQH